MSKKIIRIDIETAPLYPSEEEMPVDVMKVWKEKYREGKAEDQTPWEFFRDRSALYPEFSRIVCVSMGYEKEDKFVTKSCFGHDEKWLLGEVADLLSKFDDNWYTLWGHNIDDFDITFVRKRMILTGVCAVDTLPLIIRKIKVKPWEMDTADTMQLFKLWWKVSSWLAVMCLSLGVSSPKDDIAWADVKDIFYSEADDALDRIVSYCEKDIYATYCCYCKMYGLEILPMDHYKPYINEECKAMVDEHSEESIPLWAFQSLVSEKPYLSPSDSKAFIDYIAKSKEYLKESKERALSRNKDK